MELLAILLVLGAIVFGAKMFGFIKGFKCKPMHALVLCAICVAGAGYIENWGGFKDILQGAGVAPPAEEIPVTPGVTFEAEGSESDANLTYDQATRVFTCSYYENIAAGQAQDKTAAASAITSVTLTITVFRTDLAIITSENATAKIWAVVPTFYGKNENSSILYWPVDKDSSSQKYEVAFTPAGGSARDEYNFFTVGAGGSKAITIVADTYHTGLCQLDNFQSKDVAIHITGLTETFTLRYVKIGET